AVEQQREGDDRGAEHDQREHEADEIAHDHKLPAAPSAEHISDEAGEAGRPGAAVEMIVERLCSQKPGDEQHHEKDAEPDDGGNGWRRPDVQSMPPGHVEAQFTPTTDLVEAD